MAIKTKDLGGDPRWVEPLAWDNDDNLYLLWDEGTTLKLGVSKDNGTSWEEHDIVQGTEKVYYPYMEWSDNGLLCTWVSGFRDKLRHHAALLNVDEGKVTVTALDPIKAEIWYGGETYFRTTAGEYFPIIPLANGNFGMVTTIQNPKANRQGFTWWELVLNRY